MWRSGLQKFSSYESQEELASYSKQEATLLLPLLYLCMFQHELFLDFFLYDSLQFMFESFEMSSPSSLPPFTFNFLELCSSSRHTCPWCHVFQEMTALKYRLSKNNKQSEPEYLPCVHSSNKHHCWCWSGWCCSSETCYRLNASDLTF